MELEQVLHMNGGDGDNSYANNSSQQKEVILKAKPLLQETMTEFYCNNFPDCIRFTDMGCSTGPNALLPTWEILDALHKTCHSLNRKPPLLHVFLNDLPGNDFNKIFKSLPGYIFLTWVQVYGNNVEIQALSEMYNRPIHIYSYSTEPINIFHGSYNTDTPPIRLSYHHGNHYNSLVDPRRLTIGAGLGFSCLRGTNVDKDQVKAAIKAQQDQQIDNALLAEGRFYSDLELTEKEIECMVMEVSRAEYLANDKFKQQLARKDSSTSGAEPSSSGARSSCSESKVDGGRESNIQDTVLSSGMQMVLSMGFSYLQVIEAYSIFGDDVDSMVCYLLETGSSSRRKGKATE
ncbi:OVARIAN TUMOR DOMAIN-containing deubiquitinating enzyme 6-like [Pistacia vera]|uniref:OVARIAN TUMOR DOMAIN-containing deubiquitinating enzyme 6-like n=1 Tax=Pistacia vera TaxID=55513 RepID=UPI0012633099|nr:OVARIAN TUMOR DOMAIN-containing deubiquitinating enzyme 6-like [Pistacia vera]